MRINILSIVFFVFISSGCVETLDIDVSDTKPKIVMNGILEPDSLITIYVSKSYSYYNDFFENISYENSVTPDTIVPSILPNAKLILYINGDNKGEMDLIRVDSIFGGSIFRSQIRPKSGDKIRIEASSPGFTTAEVETQIPFPIIINKIDTTTYIKYQDDFRFVDGTQVPASAKSLNMRFLIDIENNDKENPCYYSFDFKQFEEVYNNNINYKFYRNPHVDVSSDPLFAENAENAIYAFFSEKNSNASKIIFNDRQFKDDKYTLNFSLWGYYYITYLSYSTSTNQDIYSSPITIEIVSLSEELYQYYKIRSSGSYDSFDMLSEPSTSYTNVQNGIGVVCSRTSLTREIVIPIFNGEKLFKPQNKFLQNYF